MTDIIAAGKENITKTILLPYSRAATLCVLTATLLIVLVMFNRFPVIDIAVSRLLFAEVPCPPEKLNALACGAFTAQSVPLLAMLRPILQALPLLLAVGLGIYLLVRLIRGARLLSPEIVAGSAVFWTYVISVGFLVNTILKEHWGRPRPASTILFGGDAPFVPAGEVANSCPSNCSFVSGEAASSFWLICLATLLPSKWRPLGFAAATALATITSMMRVVFGAHFVSDIVLAGLTTLLVFSLMAVTAARISARGFPSDDRPT